MDLVLCAAGRQSIDFDAMANPDWASHDRFSQEPPAQAFPRTLTSGSMGHW